MNSAEIRQSFLDFFRSKQHTIVPSSSLLPDSPNLLFTNAGMNQFVPIFLGQRKADVFSWPNAINWWGEKNRDGTLNKTSDTRAADTQKCIRAGGKHNDLDDVGLDTYHHTFFEMLGNWSFGDYFKKEAIEWAWELVVGRWKFPANRLYATVYKPGLGDPAEFDQEAYDHWARLFTTAGLDPRVHIVHGDKQDNFWMMGETGPCGPCSEIHVDLTPSGDTKGSLVNKGDARCIEIWNLVFIQLNANPDGTFSPLPAKHVDTGMGFERVTSIIQCTRDFSDFANAKISNYETDIFRPIFDELEKLSGKKYGSTLPQRGGSAGVPPAPVSVPLTGSSHIPATDAAVASSDASGSAPAEAAARDAQQSDRDGRAPPATYYKRRLPHFERPWAKYMVSFTTRERRQLSPPAREIVLKSLLFGHEQRRYQLYATCVMPEHVHMLFEPQIKEQDTEGKPVFWPLKELLHSIKSFTAHEINRLEKTTGPLWENESFDRMIRGDADLEEKFHYICRNPWDSGVVPVTENYPWLWTPDVRGETQSSPLTGSSHAPATDAAVASSHASASAPAEAAARDAQQSDRDGRAPHAQEQVQVDIAFRVIADHIRTLSFAIADGIQPSNEGRGYVLRRILRRAVRYGRTLGFHEPFFYKLVDVVADTMGQVFPEIRARKKHVQEVIMREEEAFNKTLDRGIELFDEIVKSRHAAARAELSAEAQQIDGGKNAEATAAGWAVFGTVGAEAAKPLTDRVRKAATIPAEEAFRLYDTYGFPLDLTELMAREHGLTVDVEGFNKLMDEQRARARAAQKKEVVEVSQIETKMPTKFVGYDTLETQTKVVEVVSLKDKTAVVLDTSVCYAEMGGQVGDTGELEHGPQLWRISNTQKSGNTWLHFIQEGSAGVPPAVVGVSPTSSAARDAQRSDRDGRAPQSEKAALPIPGDTVILTVDRPRRAAIQRHHTVTHLFHWALHEVVSKDATQKGSYVGPDKLTFDFNSGPLAPQQISDIEKLVNERILENAAVSWIEVSYADVKTRKDVRQFFGEKYGDTVRVVQIGGRPQALDGYSLELCGGTHTRATGEIGLFRIVAESAIAAGVRRIEAVAGLEAYRKTTNELHLIRTLAGKVNSPVGELEKKIEALLAHQKELEKQVKIALQRNASNAASELLGRAQTVNGIPFIAHNLGDADGDFLQAIADALKGRFKGVVVLGGCSNNAVALVATVSPEFTAKVQAGKIVQQIAPIVGGKGGGKPDNARGGGKDASKLDEALTQAKALLG